MRVSACRESDYDLVELWSSAQQFLVLEQQPWPYGNIILSAGPQPRESHCRGGLLRDAVQSSFIIGKNHVAAVNWTPLEDIDPQSLSERSGSVRLFRFPCVEAAEDPSGLIFSFPSGSNSVEGTFISSVKPGAMPMVCDAFRGCLIFARLTSEENGEVFLELYGLKWAASNISLLLFLF